MTSNAQGTIRVVPLDDSNLSAALEFTAAILGRNEDRALQDWRYRDCPMLEGAVAMVDQECVGTMFALRRTYLTAEGPRGLLEPFEWHSSEEWRAQAPGMRLARMFMRGDRPLVGLPGTRSASGLLRGLRWHSRGFVEHYVLPLTGRFLKSRGRGRFVALAFDLAGRPLFRPSARRGRLTLVESEHYPAGAAALAAAQKRFALMREPDATALAWLQRAPKSVGRYRVIHLHEQDDLVGWALTREYKFGGVRAGEILELFLRDDSRDAYPEAVRAVSARLASAGADMITVTSSCPDTIAGLRATRFRLDDRREAFVYWKPEPAPEGAVLIDGAIADHAFFPLDASAA